MPFMTHTEGGSWPSGPATTVTNCGAEEVIQIRHAFAFLVSHGHLSVIQVGLPALAACLAGKTEATLSVDCLGPGCGEWTPATGSAGGINLCGKAFSGQDRVDAALFHACVLSCGGLEIDAWALENHCYAGHGTRAPDEDERENVLKKGTSSGGTDIFVGTFVTWNRAVGTVEVTSSGMNLNVNYQAYKGPAGGSWP